jgi:two-component system nitrogen regulation response regulator GlnG
MRRVVSYQPLLESEDYDIGIVGRSEPMQRVFKVIGQLATSDATALITGESGTGKELVARAIYQHSSRADQAFLAINCAAIPEQLLESELFGHEKGALTGATIQRIGKFEQCNNGTVFLDEIGDMTPATQTKILRVLQSGTFERVGAGQPIRVNVRIIAATNKPLEQSVAARQFREDLFYRLNVVRIVMPPLRERREDIHLLVNYFLRKFTHDAGRPLRSISEDAVTCLEHYDWPGNVRELENVIQRALVMCKGEAILRGDLPSEVLGGAQKREAAGATAADHRPVPSPAPGAGETAGASDDIASLARRLFSWARDRGDLKIIPAVERELIIQALIVTEGNQVQAAKLLGITRATLRKRVEKFGIKQHLAVQ